MANAVKMKRSAVPGKVPTVADLDLGELAINTYDGKAYMKKNVSGVETVVLLTGAGAAELNASNLTSGTVPTARLGTGTANSATFLRGDQSWQSVPTPTIASTAEAQAGIDNTTFITPLRMREGFNASGSAPVYACRAWVNFDGSPSSASIRASGNVSSVSKLGNGNWGVNFATAMPDANYAPMGAVRSGSDGFPLAIAETALTTTTATMWSKAIGGTASNPPVVSVAVFR